MKRILLLLLIANIPSPVEAAIHIPALTPYVLSPLDTLRFRADSARYAGKFVDSERLVRDLLLRNPGDGFALREIVQLSADRDDEKFDTKLSGNGADLLPGVSLGAADLFFIRGLHAYYHGRAFTAFRSFGAALHDRPNWGWAHLYAARSLERLVQPSTQVDSSYLAALADPSAAPLALASLLRRAALKAGGAWPEETSAVAAWLRTVPWARTEAERLELERELDGPTLDRAGYESAWRRARERLGPLAADVADQLGLSAGRLLPPAEALSFFEEREREGIGFRDWRLAKAKHLSDFGATTAALECLMREGRTDPLRARLDLMRALESADRKEITRLADRLMGISMLQEDVAMVTRALSILGEDARLEGFLKARSTEDPWYAIYDRNQLALADDPRAVRDLIDSLETSGAEYPIFETRQMLREALGDTVATSELAPQATHYASVQAWNLGDLAYANGNVARARRLWDYGDARYARHWPVLLSRLFREPGTTDSASAVATARQVLALAPDSPVLAYAAATGLVQNGDEEGASEYLLSRLRSSKVTPELWTNLVYVSEAAHRPELADSFLARVMTVEPRARSAREARGWLHLTRGERDLAREVLSPLAKELPRFGSVSQMLASLDSSPVQGSSEEGKKSASSSDARSEPEDLKATAWILARAAATDTFRTSPYVYLAHRSTYVCKEVGAYELTERVTLRLQSRESVDAFRTMKVAFMASDGAPRVIVARTVQPDGVVLDVPPADMVVTADAEASVDVGESRSLVIPMPGLKVGSVVDIAYVTQHKSPFGSQWSWLTVLPQDGPALESTVEARVRKGLRVTFRSGGAVPSPQVVPSGDATITRWSAGPIPTMRLEPSASSWFDQVPWVAATSVESWAAAADLYRNSFWKQIKVTGEVKDLAKRLVGSARTPSEKLDSLFHYVSQNVNYTAIEFGEGRVVPTPAHEVLKNGYGDCKGMAGLLIALCEASGIEAWPVLVPVSGGPVPREGFVSLGLFNHMIVYAPGVDGGRFCDPTSRALCSRDLPASLAGNTGLTFGRSAPGRLIQISLPDARGHGISLEMDVRPLSGSTEARFDVVARLRGDPARAVDALLHSSDSSLVQGTVDRILSSALPSTCRRERWSLESRGCQTLSLSGSYRDTAWATDGNEIQLRLRTEVADPLFHYPSPRGRQFPVRVEYPFADTVVIRLHGGPMWDPSDELAASHVQGATYQGSYESQRVERGTDSWVEIVERFELRDRSFTPEAFAQFHRDWSRYVAAVSQPYRFRRHLDASQLERLEAYSRSHPDDVSFALEAARRILAGDGGGTGLSGAARRTAARNLLSPQLGKPEAGARPYVLLAYAAIGERRFHRADSLAKAARAIDKGNVEALVLHAALREELGDVPGSLVAQEELQRATGSEPALLSSITTLYRLGRDADAKQAEDRYSVLVSHPDSTALLRARFYGLLRAHRCNEAKDAFARLGADSSLYSRLLEADVCRECDNLARAVEIYEQLLEQYPLLGFVCNNLAWAYVILGQNLDRAGDLLLTASLLDPEDTAILNSQAVLELREGRITSAQRILESALIRDDRPASEVANRYFLGLCDWAQGHRAKARSTWTEILPRADEKWQPIIRRSLDLAEKGERPDAAVFDDSLRNLTSGHD